MPVGPSILRARAPNSRPALCLLAASFAFCALGCADDPAPAEQDEAPAQRRDSGADGPGQPKDDSGMSATARDAGTVRDGASGARGDGSTRLPADDPEQPVDGGRDAGPSTANRDAGTATPGDASAPSTSGGQCGGGQLNRTPFGCDFAWGTNDPGSPISYASDLGFITKWVGYEVEKSGALKACDGCSWLTTQFAQTSAVPVYYAYFIGFFGKANGLMDQNENPNGPNLATDASKLIRNSRAALIEMYASYAKQTAKVWPSKPLVWLLEGDFVQYTYREQKEALSMKELGELARDITCAIKSNMPNAVVSLNHSTWLSDEVTNGMWEEFERAGVAYDLVWTTGVANNMGFLESGAKPGYYNEKTATYKYLSQKTGRKIFVDTSFGLSGMADTWASATAATINERIADGVIAGNVTMPAADFPQRIRSFKPMLDKVCK